MYGHTILRWQIIIIMLVYKIHLPQSRQSLVDRPNRVNNMKILLISLVSFKH